MLTRLLFISAASGKHGARSPGPSPESDDHKPGAATILNFYFTWYGASLPLKPYAYVFI